MVEKNVNALKKLDWLMLKIIDAVVLGIHTVAVSALAVRAVAASVSVAANAVAVECRC